MPSTKPTLSLSQKQNPRRVALGILLQLEKQRSNSALLLQESMKNLSAADRNLVTDLVLGALRWRLRLEFLIEAFSKRSTRKLDDPVRLILQVGLYQLLYTGIPQHAAVNESVELCKKMKLSSAAPFVNGILRAIQKNLRNLPDPVRGEPASYLSIRFSHPLWMVRRWLDRFGEQDTVKLLQINNEPEPVYVRVNELAISSADLQSHLSEEGVQSAETEFGEGVLRIERGSPQQTSSFANGEFYIQDAGVERIGQWLELKPNTDILEIAVAPGGKTFQIALRTQERARIISVDSDFSRMKKWKENIFRLKLKSAIPVVADARALPFEKQFDVLLIDAPCSSLGIVRRHPEIKWRRDAKDLDDFHKLQVEILNACSRHVKKEGRLYYCVCSFEPEETTQVVEAFLNFHSDFQQRKSFLLLPHQDGTDGFFLAEFGRV